MFLWSHTSVAFLPSVHNKLTNPWSSEIQRLAIDSYQVTHDETDRHHIQEFPEPSTYARKQALHTTIRNLQMHLPSLLQTPLSAKEALQTYQEDTQLTLNLNQGREIVLTSNVNELIALSSAIVTGNQAATQVSQILSSSFLGKTFSSNQDKTAPTNSLLGKLIHCTLWIDEASLINSYEIKNEYLVIHIDWSASVPSSITAIADFIPFSTLKSNPPVGINQWLDSQSNITGRSLLTINISRALVAKHQIYSLQINGRDILSVASTAESIAFSVRENAMTFMKDNAFIQSVVNVAALEQTNNAIGIPALKFIRDGVLQQIQESSNRLYSSRSENATTEEHVLAPLFVAMRVHNSNSSDVIQVDRELFIPIDDYAPSDVLSTSNVRIPFPGSKEWEKFSLHYKIINKFYLKGLDALVTGDIDNDRNLVDLQGLFDRDATLETNDGFVLLSGRLNDGTIRVANIYQNLSRMRSATIGDWQLKSFKVTDWSSMICSITWETQTPIRIRGEDEFTLKPLMTENDHDDDPGYQIMKVKQIFLEVNNVRVKDFEWVQGIIFAIEQSSSQLSMVPTNNAFIELLRQLGGGTSWKPYIEPKNVGPPPLSSSASASVYGAMRAFYIDIVDFPDIKTLYPAAAYISDKIELRGLIDETLARGRESYSQAWFVASRTLKTLLSTNRFRIESPPETTSVELTKEGLLRTNMMFQLRIDTNFPNPLNVLLSSNEDEKIDKGLPLKYELISEYKLNEDGEIIVHRLCESKINGRLTPGDVLSRWILGKDGLLKSSDPSNFVQVLEFIKWIQGYITNKPTSN